VVAPGAWRASTCAACPAAVSPLDLHGPSGAELFAFGAALPFNKSVTTDQLGALVQARGVGVPDVEADLTQLRVIDLRAGQALRVDATYKGQKAAVLYLPRPGKLWVVVATAAGSQRASRDLNAMVASLTVP
jgi:hypothetical protein